MPQMISRNTVLLQGAGRTNIEYSAGPNINITNDVISGRDWSNEIAKGNASAVSSHLSAGDHIDLNTNSGGITTISVTGDFYSAGDNIDITNNVISGKDWTNDIDSHIESAISGKADASAIPEIVDYSAGDNINITDHVISGKDWSYEIGQKADRSEVIERISAASESIVNNLTETISSTSSELYDIISATSGQGGGGSCPWISGGKDYGSATVQLNFGDTIPVFSSWDLSGDHNHYIWMKGAYVRLPDGSEFLPISSFSSYTASMASNMSSNWDYTNSAYSMAISNTHNKLDNSAFSAYTAAHSADDVIPYSGGNGIDVTNHVISYTGTEGQAYSAGDNIDITNNVISGKDWNGEISAASSILNQMIASGDNVAYSAGNNIDITDHIVSGKDWTSEINAATSGKLDSSWTAGKDVTPYSGASGIQVQNHVISITGDVGKTYSAGANINITNDVISGKDWTDTIDSHIESAISGIEVPSSKPVSGTSGIKIEETENSVVFSISGDVGKTYSAGANINISNQNVISGKDWTPTIESAVSGITGDFVRHSEYTLGIGSGVSANGRGAFAHGVNVTAGMQSFANGESAKAGNICLANGRNVSATSESLANGQAVTANHDSLANGSFVSADYTAAAAGNYVTAYQHSLAVGYRVKSEYDSIAIGQSASADNGSIAGGWRLPYSSMSAGSGSIAWGPASVAVNHSMAFGQYASAYTGSLAFGEGVIASSYLMALGRYNRTSSNAAFVIGNGNNSSQRSDLMLLDRSGNLYISGNVYVSGNSPITGGIEYSGVSPVQVDNTNHTIGLELPSWQLCAGPNIEIEEDALTRHLNVSGKDWTNDITSAISAWSAGQTFGSDYTSPSGTILVNNDNGTLEASTSGIADVIEPTTVYGSTVNPYGLTDIVSNKAATGTLSLTGGWGPNTAYYLIVNSDSIIASSWSATWGEQSNYTASWDNLVLGSAQTLKVQLGKSLSFTSTYSGQGEPTHSLKKVDLWDNYSAGPGISIENHIISAGAGNKVSYWYNTPVTGISAEGDLLISRQVASTTPDKIRVKVGSSDVGLLVPANTGHNSMLVTNAMGSVQWADQSAIIPSAAEQAHKVRVYSNDATYDGDNALNDYPALDHDWEFTIINQYDNSAHWLYYSALAGTATLNPGRGVRVYYCQNTNTLYSEPEFVTDFGDDYATQWGDLGGLKLREVGTSAEASGNGILYVITGGN